MFLTQKKLASVGNLPALWYILKHVRIKGIFAPVPDTQHAVCGAATGELSHSWGWKVPGMCPKASGDVSTCPGS